MEQTIYWTNFKHGDVAFVIAAVEQGLCYTGSLHEDETELVAFKDKHFKGYALVEDAEKLTLYTTQLTQYFDKKKRELDFPIYYKGTPFQESVWQQLQQIPYGETRAYLDIAQRIGNPKAVRAVGGAIGANPLLIAIPCHRVIGKNGALTGFSAGIELKKVLLAIEQE